MSLNRHAARRDSNDGELQRVAEQMGWYLYRTKEPGDYLGFLKARPDLGFSVIEIKHEDGSLTDNQSLFRKDCLVWNMPYLIWRNVADVVEQTNTLRRAP